MFVLFLGVVSFKDIVGSLPTWNKPKSTRIDSCKPPSWDLTSLETMKFIEKGDARRVAKEHIDTKEKAFLKKALREERKKNKLEKLEIERLEKIAADRAANKFYVRSLFQARRN